MSSPSSSPIGFGRRQSGHHTVRRSPPLPQQPRRSTTTASEAGPPDGRELTAVRAGAGSSNSSMGSPDIDTSSRRGRTPAEPSGRGDGGRTTRSAELVCNRPRRQDFSKNNYPFQMYAWASGDCPHSCTPADRICTCGVTTNPGVSRSRLVSLLRQLPRFSLPPYRFTPYCGLPSFFFSCNAANGAGTTALAAAAGHMYVPLGMAPRKPRSGAAAPATRRSTHPASLYVSWLLIQPGLLESCQSEQTFNTRIFARGPGDKRYFGPLKKVRMHCINAKTGVVAEDKCGNDRVLLGGRLFNPTPGSVDERTMRARLAVLVQEVRVPNRPSLVVSELRPGRSRL